MHAVRPSHLDMLPVIKHTHKNTTVVSCRPNQPCDLVENLKYQTKIKNIEEVDGK